MPLKHIPVLLLLCGTLLHAQTSSPIPATPIPVESATPATSPYPSAVTTPYPVVPAMPGTPAPIALPAQAVTPSAEPSATAAQAQPVEATDLVTRLQIFLDQQDFGPGIIDGRWGEFTGKALVHYARAHNLKVTPAIYDQLPLDTVFPIYTTYTITPADGKTVGECPGSPAEAAKMKRMPYPSLTEFLEERYHCSPDFIQKLNPHLKLDNLKVGDTVRVPNVEPFKIEDIKPEEKLPRHPEFKNRTIYVNTKEKMLDLYDGKKGLIASFPITPGSKTLPAPVGVWEIVGLVALPEFRWDKAMLEHGHRSSNFYQIPSGPRNPVGVLWCALDKTGIGIHGTDSPQTIGRAGSHGCIRLANWDAIRFSKMVTPGMTVTIE